LGTQLLMCSITADSFLKPTIPYCQWHGRYAPWHILACDGWLSRMIHWLGDVSWTKFHYVTGHCLTTAFFCNDVLSLRIILLASDSQRKGTNVPSISSPLVDEEWMRSGNG